MKFQGRTQNILPTKVAADLPALGSESHVVHVKLFTPYGGWTWLLTEYDPASGEAFGFAYNASDPCGAELGYVSVAELRSLGARLGRYTVQAVERDTGFRPCALGAAVDRECPGARNLWVAR